MSTLKVLLVTELFRLCLDHDDVTVLVLQDVTYHLGELGKGPWDFYVLFLMIACETTII